MSPLALLLLQAFIVSAELLSSARVFTKGGAEAELNCWGDPYVWDPHLRPDRAVRTTLAAYCANVIRMEVGYKRFPKRAFYAKIGYPAYYRSIRGLSASEWYEAVDSYYEIGEKLPSFLKDQWMMLEVCSIKCSSAAEDAIKPIEPFASVQSSWEVIYNFDRFDAVLDEMDSQAGVTEHAQPVYGWYLGDDPGFRWAKRHWEDTQGVLGMVPDQAELDALDTSGMPWNTLPPPSRPIESAYAEEGQLANTFLRPQDDETSPIVGAKLMGYKANAPICDKDYDITDAFGPEVEGLFHKFLGGADQEIDATELCAHQFFGGRSKGNLGGYCAYADTGPGPENLRYFFINDALKAPQLTDDYYPPSLEQSIFSRYIEHFCGAHCHCAREPEVNTTARRDLWEQWKGAIGDVTSQAYKELRAEAHAMEAVLETPIPTQPSFAGGIIIEDLVTYPSPWQVGEDDAGDNGMLLPDDMPELNPAMPEDGGAQADDGAQDDNAAQADEVAQPATASATPSGSPYLPPRPHTNNTTTSKPAKNSTAVQTLKGCTSNADCCATCVCIVSWRPTLNSWLANIGLTALQCIARNAINPKPRDPSELRRRDLIEFYAVESWNG